MAIPGDANAIALARSAYQRMFAPARPMIDLAALRATGASDQEIVEALHEAIVVRPALKSLRDLLGEFDDGLRLVGRKAS